jgi:hypothetical protein
MTQNEFANKYLSPPIRKRYVNNCLSQGRNINLNKNTDNLAAYIMFAFTWMVTPEDDMYWSNLHSIFLRNGATNEDNTV